ncbi:2,3-bisphosphoglycerate-dependent phosphoglycerate mutase [Candidatus Ecksteinia adelgidicola]|nr:2,3-bisphosphoglycerate-dependent phosphoglycerate mutase [Candidatus Ecksteinia adelgidicola]
MSINKLVLVRHGESYWNSENRFTGWSDIDLSDRGYNEARKVGRLLKEQNIYFDLSYTSVLKRTIHTLWIILDILNQSWIPHKKSWKLNERHYGALEGLNKLETAKKYGDEQVKKWRRSFSIAPPKVSQEDKRYPGHDARYNLLTKQELPLSESLEDTANRVVPYWNKKIFPQIKQGQRVIIVAHGNSLRALIKHLDHLNKDDIIELNIPTGLPLVYEFDNQFNQLKHYYLT